MTATSPTPIAARVEAAILGTTGVRTVYRAGSLLSNLVGEGAIALGVRGADEPLVAVAFGDDGVEVEASLGIDYTVGAVETLRAARASVVDALAAEGLVAAAVVLTIAYVHPREASSD
jgi:hypothetical protein